MSGFSFSGFIDGLANLLSALWIVTEVIFSVAVFIVVVYAAIWVIGNL